MMCSYAQLYKQGMPAQIRVAQTERSPHAQRVCICVCARAHALGNRGNILRSLTPVIVLLRSPAITTKRTLHILDMSVDLLPVASLFEVLPQATSTRLTGKASSGALITVKKSHDAVMSATGMPVRGATSHAVT